MKREVCRIYTRHGGEERFTVVPSGYKGHHIIVYEDPFYNVSAIYATPAWELILEAEENGWGWALFHLLQNYRRWVMVKGGGVEIRTRCS